MLKTKEEFFLDILRSLDADFNINKSNRKKLLLTEKTKKTNMIYFMKDGVVYVEQDEKNGISWYDYDKIWSIFEKKYGMNYQQIQEFVKSIIERRLIFKELTPMILP